MRIRPELQGLRAIAVLLVIINHAYPKVLPGGFIGVDIFFVLSGYLITLILTNETDKSFKIYLGHFYSKRVRRILPSALFVIVFSYVIARWILGPVVASDTARDGIWASLFLANVHFNKLSMDYFESGLPLPILQHYWSLAIEEQFYLVWPLFLYFLVKRRRSPRFAIGLVTLGSLLYSIIEVANGSLSAYFGTFTRLWELGVGAILAFTHFSSRRFISQISLGLLIVLGFVFSNQTPFPGIAAFVVVLLTAVFIGTSSLNSITSFPLLVYVGNISYLLYLWHWPVLQIARLYGDLSNDKTGILVLLTFVLSVITHHCFEKPIRYSRLLSNSLTMTFSFGISITALTLVIMVAK